MLGDGCLAIRAVVTKKTLLYIYLIISAWTLHVSVTAITHLHHHVFGVTTAADSIVHDAKSGDKGSTMVTADVMATAVIADTF